jgi:hypothetical protein
MGLLVGLPLIDMSSLSQNFRLRLNPLLEVITLVVFLCF